MSAATPFSHESILTVDQTRSQKSNTGNIVRRLLTSAQALRVYKYSGVETVQSDEVKKLLKKGGWRNLLRRLEEQERLITTNAQLFEREQRTRENLTATAIAINGWNPWQHNPLPELKGRAFHINYLIQDLSQSPTATHIGSCAWSVLGGVCNNIFQNAYLNYLQYPTWINRPLPKLPRVREVAVNWITTNAYAQANLLLQHIEFGESDIPGKMASFKVDSTNLNESMIQEIESIVHVFHLADLKTYHIALYREHLINLPFETSKHCIRERHQSKQVGRREVFSPPSGLKNSIVLYGDLSSKCGSPSGDPTIQSLLTREFLSDEEYCIVGISITEDETLEISRGNTREMISWTILRCEDVGSTCKLFQFSVTLGLQRGRTFVPYDNLPVDEYDPFQSIVDHLKVHYRRKWDQENIETQEMLNIKRERVVDMVGLLCENENHGDDFSNENSFLSAPGLSSKRPGYIRESLSAPKAKKLKKNPRLPIQDVYDASQYLARAIQNPLELAIILCFISDHPLHATSFVAMIEENVTKEMERSWINRILHLAR